MPLNQPKAVPVEYLHTVDNGKAHAPLSQPPSAGRMLSNMDTTYSHMGPAGSDPVWCAANVGLAYIYAHIYVIQDHNQPEVPFALQGEVAHKRTTVVSLLRCIADILSALQKKLDQTSNSLYFLSAQQSHSKLCARRQMCHTPWQPGPLSSSWLHRHCRLALNHRLTLKAVPSQPSL